MIPKYIALNDIGQVVVCSDKEDVRTALYLSVGLDKIVPVEKILTSLQDVDDYEKEEKNAEVVHFRDDNRYFKDDNGAICTITMKDGVIFTRLSDFEIMKRKCDSIQDKLDDLHNALQEVKDQTINKIDIILNQK